MAVESLAVAGVWSAFTPLTESPPQSPSFYGVLLSIFCILLGDFKGVIYYWLPP